jgi:hypothetical protein
MEAQYLQDTEERKEDHVKMFWGVEEFVGRQY